MKLLSKKVAIVTGGSRGIGKAIVERLAAHGASVVFTYHSSAAKANELVANLSEQYPEQSFKAYQSDASVFEQAADLVNNVVKEFGTIDILVNNAGIARDNLLLRMTETQWDDVLSNNLKSVFNLSKHVAKPMLKQRSGSIINITSIIGLKGNAGQANYAASKAGIVGFTKSVAQELGSCNIRCNAIAPGYIETDMTDNLGEGIKESFVDNIPMKRFGKATEVADAVVFLASDMAAYISGQTLSVCGALTM